MVWDQDETEMSEKNGSRLASRQIETEPAFQLE